MELNITNQKKMDYLTPTQVDQKFGYHPKTLAEWADQGKIEFIRSPGGHRRYPVAAFLGETKQPQKEKKVILYARVSTRTQTEALQNQIQYLSEHFPGEP